MAYGPYHVAAIVTSLLVTGVLLPTLYYLKQGPTKGATFVSKGCFIPGSCAPDFVCKARACKATANRILSNMDKTVDRCQNFYKYACGNFLKTAKIEKYKGYAAPDVEVDLKLSEQLKAILETKPKDKDPPCFTTARQLYKLCMNEKNIKAQGLEPIKQFIEAAGGWPVLDANWDATGWDLSQAVLRLRRLGGDANSLFKLIVVDNNGNFDLHVNQPDLLVPASTILQGPDSEKVKHYYTYMVETAVLLGADPVKAENDMAFVYQLQMFLAKVLPSAADRAGQTHVDGYPIQFLADNVGFLDWSGIHRGTMPSSDPNRIRDYIFVMDLNYIDLIGELILPRFSPQIIMNYMMWYAIFSLMQLLPETARDIEFKYEQGMYGFQARQPRWMECVLVADKITYAVGSLYVKNYLGDNTKTAVTDIANRLREELRQDFRQLDWMDDDTKKLADLKAEKMVINIGFTEKLALDNVTSVQERYEGLQIDTKNYFQAVMDLEKWKNTRGVDYEAAVTNGLDDMARANAVYLRGKNSLHFPASVLQSPYFDPSVPNYVNYARVGSALAHEITHGFDDQGRMLDQDGKYNEWWDEPTHATFVKRAECMVSQYNGFVDSETNLPLNGLETLNENIADSGGLKLAYRAYKRLEVELSDLEQKLPGLQEFNNDQLFFLAMASQHCTVYRTDILQRIIEHSDHSPGEFRVNGPLMNLPDFGAVFNCPAGTPMNPRERCEVW